MKSSKRDILILLGAIGVLAVVCAVFLIYQPYMEKVETLTAENTQLLGKVEYLTGINDNKEFYKKEIDRMTSEIEAVYEVFPVDVREEDCIMMAINQEIVSPMLVESITIEPVVSVDFSDRVAAVEDNNPYYDLGEGDVGLGVDTELDETASQPSSNSSEDTLGMLRTRKATMNYIASYEGVKRSIQHIGVQSNRIAIDSLTLAYDETTGLLIGSATLDMYLAPYQEDKEYVEQNLSSVLLGTDNIFGTIVVNGESGMPGVVGEAAGEETEEE